MNKKYRPLIKLLNVGVVLVNGSCMLQWIEKEQWLTLAINILVIIYYVWWAIPEQAINWHKKDNDALVDNLIEP